MPDPFKQEGADAPAMMYAAVTPSDSTDLPALSRGIAFGTAGALEVVREDGTTVTIPSGVLAAGIIHPIRARRVKAAATTAANIWTFW